jgi:hypothetical protein
MMRLGGGAAGTCDVSDTYGDAYENTTKAAIEKDWPGVHAILAAMMDLALELVWNKTELVAPPHMELPVVPALGSDFRQRKTLWRAGTPAGVSVHPRF